MQTWAEALIHAAQSEFCDTLFLSLSIPPTLTLLFPADFHRAVCRRHPWLAWSLAFAGRSAFPLRTYLPAEAFSL